MNKKFFDTSLFIFCILLTFSCFSGLFLDLSYSPAIGLMALAWGIIGLLVMLWIVERVYYFKKRIQNAKKQNLSKHLISSMQRQKVFNQGMKAMRSMNSTTMSIFTCGLVYLFYCLWIAVNPQYVQSLTALNSMIESYFDLKGIEYKDNNNFQMLYMFVFNAAILLIIAIAFWLSQLYVFANAAGRNIMWLSISLFFISFFVVMRPNIVIAEFAMPPNWQNGYGWHHIDVLKSLDIIPNIRLSYFQQRLYAVGIAGTFLFYLPCLIMAMVFVRNLFHKTGEKRYPFLGLAIMLVLLYVDLFFTGTMRLFPLWLSGWSCLGLLCIRDRSAFRKIYRIHQ